MEMKQICMSLVRIHDLHKLGTTWNSDSRYIKTWPKTWLWHILNMLIVMHISLQKSYKQIVLLVRTHCQVYNPIFVVHYYHHIFWHLMHKLMNKGDFSFPIAAHCLMLNHKLLEVYLIVCIVTCNPLHTKSIIAVTDDTKFYKRHRNKSIEKINPEFV